MSFDFSEACVLVTSSTQARFGPLRVLFHGSCIPTPCWGDVLGVRLVRDGMRFFRMDFLLLNE